MSRRHWFQYVGPTGGEGTPGNYILSYPQDPLGCTSGPVLCAIYAYGGSAPIAITPNLQGYIALAKSRKHSYPDGAGQKSYAYVQGNP